MQDSPTPQPRSPAKVSSSESTPSCHYTVHQVRNTPISTQHASPPLTPSHGRDSPTVALVIPRSRENSPDLKKRAAPQGQEAQLSATAVRTGPLSSSQLMEEITFNINTSMSEEVNLNCVFHFWLIEIHRLQLVQNIMVLCGYIRSLPGNCSLPKITRHTADQIRVIWIYRILNEARV